MALANELILASLVPVEPSEFALFHPDCDFTDDTVCSVAVADALLTEPDFAGSLRSFVRRRRVVFKLGIVGGCTRLWQLGQRRVTALGWLARGESEALTSAAAQAEVSHNHPDALAGAQAVALAILLARRGLPRPVFRASIAEAFGYDLAPERALAGGGFDVSVAGTVPPALTCAFEADDWESAVRSAVCLGGDTDTLACIGGAVAEAIHGLAPEIAKTARSYLTHDLRAVVERFEAALDLPSRTGI